MRKTTKEIIGLLGIIYCVAVFSLMGYTLIVQGFKYFEFQHILGVILHLAFLYYSWHWMNGIIFFNDETFLKPKDKYYKEASQKARATLKELALLMDSEDGMPIVYILFTNYKKKKVYGDALVEAINLKKEVLSIPLMKESNSAFQEDYDKQSIPFECVEDWIYQKENGSFEGGFLMKARVKKADDLGYEFDHKSLPLVNWIRSNLEN